MGFGSSFLNSFGGGVGSGITTGVNNHLRYTDKKLFGGALGIDKANSYYLYEDTYNSATANLRAAADNASYALGKQKEALLANGYNPLLAIGDYQPPTSANGHAIAQSQGGGSADFQTDLRKEQIKAAKADVKTAQAEARLATATSALEVEKAKIELEAITDDDYRIEVDGKDTNPTRSVMRSMIRNSIERSAYTNSREHAIAEDAVNAIHGGSSAMQGFQAYENARNIRRWRVK